MHWLFITALSFLIYIFIGCAVLAYLDKEGIVLEWLKDCPSVVLGQLILLAWPWLAYRCVLIYRVPDRNCYTNEAGECVSDKECMHSPKRSDNE